jgi:aminomethyltransferase
MKTTPLIETHKALGARMTDFAGFNMPISYSSIQEEHLAVRRNVGIFDVSHMGEFFIRGKEALQLVQYVTTNDASRLAPGAAQYSCMPNEEGGIVDDLLVYRLPTGSPEEEYAFMLVVNAGNIEKDFKWIESHNTFQAELTDQSEQTGLLAVQGPKATEALQPLTQVPLDDLKFYTFTTGAFVGVENVIISATGYTGAGGFELYVPADRLVEVWQAIFESGKQVDLLPVGLETQDTLRLEKGYCLYGNDINDTTTPLEAGLGWITKFRKGDFIASDILRQQKEEGVKRKLVGFKVTDRRVPRQHYAIEDETGHYVGEVTSGSQSPSLGYPIGMGYVKTELASPGTRIVIATGRKKLEAEVVKMPFL